jgi:glycosyltransferase involved in cell wall biosynthesis
MKIAHLLGWYFPDSVGGTEVYVEGLCRRLRTEGHDCVIAAPDASGAESALYEHDGIRVMRYAIPSVPTRDEATHRTAVRGTDRVRRWLADERPDILHVHSLTTGISIHELREARRLGIRVIVTCHLPGLGYLCRAGELMRWGRFPCDGVVESTKCAACNLVRAGLMDPIASAVAAIPPAAGRWLEWIPGSVGTALGMSASVDAYAELQRELFDLVDRFVVLNETARQILLTNGSPANKLTLNRLGVSQHLIRVKDAPDRRPTRRPVRFGYVGRIHPTKGLLELARAMAGIPRTINFRLDIRGPRSDAASRTFGDVIRAELACDPRVAFVPAVPPEDVLQVLAGLDVLVVPSLWFENGPTIALEAMAVGTPIVASRVGNLAEIVEDGVNGRLVDAGNVGALRDALIAIAECPETTIDAWRRGLTPPRTMDDIARDYLQVYAA